MVRTLRTTSVALVVITLLSGWWTLVQAGGNPGDAGMLSLRLGVGTRESAMGGAGVASTSGAAAAYWNPSRLAFTDQRTDIILQHYRYLGLFDQEAAALTHRGDWGVLGFLFTGLYSDEIQRYGTEPVGVPEGTFRPYDVTLGASFSRQFGERVAIGAQAKLLYQRIDIYSDTGFAMDLFMTLQPVISGLIFGLSATNLGGQMNLNAEPFDLPRTYRVGIAFSPESGFLANRMTLSGDILFPNDNNEKAHVGAEFWLVPQLALRGGTRINYEALSWTAGAGFRLGVVEVGYAYEEIKTEGLDSGHKIALELHY